MSKVVLDCQNEMHGAMRAMEGLRALLYEAQCKGKRQYEVLGPEGFAELVSMVEERFRRVEVLLQQTADEIFSR